MQTKHSTALTVTVVEISKLGLQAETTSRQQDDRFCPLLWYAMSLVRGSTLRPTSHVVVRRVEGPRDATLTRTDTRLQPNPDPEHSGNRSGERVREIARAHTLKDGQLVNIMTREAKARRPIADAARHLTVIIVKENLSAGEEQQNLPL